LGLIIGISIFSYYDLKNILSEIALQADNLRSEELSSEQLYAGASSLVENWNNIEKRLARYLSHNDIDEVTRIISQLPALAADGQSGAVLSLLDSVYASLGSLLSDSTPSLRTLI